MDTMRPAPRPSAGSFGATSFVGFAGEFVSLELMGVAVTEDNSRTYVDGDVTLARQTALDLIWEMGRSLGQPEQTERFLKDAFDWER